MDNPYESPQTDCGVSLAGRTQQGRRERRRWRIYISMHFAVVLTCMLLMWPSEDRPLLVILAGGAARATIHTWPLTGLSLCAQGSWVFVLPSMAVALFGYVRARLGGEPGTLLVAIDVLLVAAHIGAIYPGIL